MRDVRSTIFGILIAVAVIATIALLYYDRFTSDGIFAFATIIFGLSLGFVIVSFRFTGGRNSEESAVASYGLMGGGATLVAIAGTISFILAANEAKNAAVIFSVITILLFIGLFFLSSYSNESLDAISEKKDYRSNHAQWARDLNDLSLKAQSQTLRSAIRERANACRFLSRDTNSFAPMSQEINHCLENISAHVLAQKDEAAMAELATLDDLFKQRNDQLKQVRSKV